MTCKSLCYVILLVVLRLHDQVYGVSNMEIKFSLEQLSDMHERDPIFNLWHLSVEVGKSTKFWKATARQCRQY